MMTLRSVTAGAIATAMLATSVAPAAAQGYPGGGYGQQGYGYGYRGDDYRYRDYRRHDRGSDAGAIIAGVAVVGIIAAIAASAAKKQNRGYNNGYNGYNGYRGRIDNENGAADACVSAAEKRLGQGARVTGIDTVDRTRDGFSVTGTANARDYGRDYGRGGDAQSFRCTVRYGAVERVDFSGYAGYGGY